jgi:pyruvate/2-oxoglutarate dehydrogenase complex dihydrolipoamide dehydrogenase (E3) component
MNDSVIIVGGGQAGVPLAFRLAKAGEQVLLAERAHLGGTCINTGCTPTKTMIASARAAHVARTSGPLGVTAREVTVDFPAVVARKDAIVSEWRKGIAAHLGDAGDHLRVVRGQARFSGPLELEIAGERYSAKTVILNVGARAVVPSIPGLATAPFLDNAGLLALRELPAHLIVLGGGYIGCELGQMMRRFGSEVTIVDRNAHLLSREDPDISSAVEEVFRGEGIRLELPAAVESVRGGGGEVTLHLAGGREIRGSHLLVAVGRRANTDDLRCDLGGVRLDGRGFVIVDDRYATSAAHVYAVGDVAGGPQFTHSSWDDHRILFEHLQGRDRRRRSDRLIPYCVFTDPQVAGVGLSEREAKAKGVRYELATMPFSEIARARETGERAGTMKVIVDPASGKILGARLVGAEVGELIHIFVCLMEAGASAQAIVDAEFVHPTFAEGVQSLVMRLANFALG